MEWEQMKGPGLGVKMEMGNMDGRNGLMAMRELGAEDYLILRCTY